MVLSAFMRKWCICSQVPVPVCVYMFINVYTVIHNLLYALLYMNCNCFTLNVMRIHLSMKTCTMVPGVYTNSVAHISTRAKCNISKPHTAPRDRFSTIDIMVLNRRGWCAIWWWRNGTIFFFPFFFQLHFQLHFQSNLFVFLAIGF